MSEDGSSNEKVSLQQLYVDELNVTRNVEASNATDGVNSKRTRQEPGDLAIASSSAFFPPPPPSSSSSTGAVKAISVWEDLPPIVRQTFLSGIFETGMDEATPKKILLKMHEASPKLKEIELRHIKSHLQRYRLHAAIGRKIFIEGLKNNYLDTAAGATTSSTNRTRKDSLAFLDGSTENFDDFEEMLEQINIKQEVDGLLEKTLTSWDQHKVGEKTRRNSTNNVLSEDDMAFLFSDWADNRKSGGDDINTPRWYIELWQL